MSKVLENIKNGVYTNKLQYPCGGIENRDEVRKAYLEEGKRIMDEFRKDVLIELGLLEFSKITGEVLFQHKNAYILIELAELYSEPDYYEIYKCASDLALLLK